MDPLTQLVADYPGLEPCQPDIQAAFEMLQASFQAGGKLLVCGNGGSAADAEHIVGELMKGYRLGRPLPHDVRRKILAAEPENGLYLADHLQGALPAISLVSQVALTSAFANDVSPDLIFAQQVYGYGRPGDVLLGISTSGNAVNVLYALQLARALGLATIGLSGPTGGAMKPYCQVAICVPGASTTTIQEHHMPVYHALCAMLEEAFFPA